MTLSTWHVALTALAATVLCSGLVWIVSAVRGNAAIADRIWSILIMMSAFFFVFSLAPIRFQAIAMLLIGSAWALRLSLFITWRSWGQPEERRYADMRLRNQPHFVWKSLYLVFILQALLAWLIAMPFLAVALTSRTATDWSWLDSLGTGLAVFGLLFETISDAQMAAFKAQSPARSSVMQSGLWRYSRHPNYFGESCLWWGFALIALSTGAWWALLSPVLITYLLLRVSGITLQEKDAHLRGAAYMGYVRRTSAFVPWPPRWKKPIQKGSKR